MKNDRAYHRFAVSVNRKIGSSVQRNYIKRVMKEWFRLNRHRMPEDKSYDFWVVMKNKFTRDNVREIRQLLMNTLEKVSRLK